MIRRCQQMRIGICQSRGLGDIIIALPLAHYLYKQGNEIEWPIAEHWCEQMRAVAPWVTWHELSVDWGPYFLRRPLEILKKRQCDEIIPLYNSLTGSPEFQQTPYFQHVSFDRYKYLRAGVPFREKWKLNECVERFPLREQALKDSLMIQGPYVLCHLESSQQRVRIPDGLIPPEFQRVDITDQGWIWDWRLTIEQAECVIMTDSCVANMTDQLMIPVEGYFIPQHHIQLTPQHLGDWQWLTNPDLNPNTRFFQ